MARALQRVPDKVIKFLKDHPEQHFTAKEIAEWIFESYPDECQARRKKIADNQSIEVASVEDKELIAKISSDVHSRLGSVQKKEPGVKRLEDSPRKYYYTTKSDEAEITEVETPQGDETSLSTSSAGKPAVPKEHDLYPLLAEFLYNEFPAPEGKQNKRGIYVMETAYGGGSKKDSRGSNKWLYPDVVAMESLTTHWIDEIKKAVKASGDKTVKLWSFEVKRHINRTTVREDFFQAVSNSSWANYGYLVAAELNSNATHELRILSALHGIGFINLNIEEPLDSQIVFPARERDRVDWDTANRLASESRNFREYIEDVEFFQDKAKTSSPLWYPIPKYDD